jgi:exosome complex RNA-binding protein Rrp42 (RNase PH superfamily)
MTRASSPVTNGKAKVALGDDTALTLAQKGRGNPFDPANYGEIVKPGELVDIVELSPLTLADRRSTIC